MIMKDKISVIIPVYKVENTLDACIESVVNQTYENLEIILVDDGSPDSCPKKCEEWAEKDSRIVVLHKKNGGLSSARNLGLYNVTGDYVAFVDSDDFLDLTAYEKMLNKMKKDNLDVVLCNYWCYKSSGKDCYPMYKDSDVYKCLDDKQNVLKLMTLEKLPTTQWSRMIKKSVLYRGEHLAIGFEEGRRYEDTIPSFKQILGAERVGFIEEPLYYYVDSSESIVSNPKIDDVYDLIHNTEIIRSLLNNAIDLEYIECYLTSTLAYAYQLFTRFDCDDMTLKRELIDEIRSSCRKLRFKKIFESNKWIKILLCKLNLFQLANYLYG